MKPTLSKALFDNWIFRTWCVLWHFGILQARACVFGGFLLGLMLFTLFWPANWLLHRYDFIFLSAVLFQIVMILFRLEQKREVVVILIFHLVATGMELFKTHDTIGSWTYPEEAFFKVWNVPLFTGFMYGAVGSYLSRVWRLFHFEFSAYPKRLHTILLVLLIYINFFTHHFFLDIRWMLFIWAWILFRKTYVHYQIGKKHYRMYLFLGFALVSLFLWFAENIATFSNVWLYPHQMESWALVPLSKWMAWVLLMLLSFVLVTLVHMSKATHPKLSNFAPNSLSDGHQSPKFRLNP